MAPTSQLARAGYTRGQSPRSSLGKGLWGHRLSGRRRIRRSGRQRFSHFEPEMHSRSYLLQPVLYLTEELTVIVVSAAGVVLHKRYTLMRMQVVERVFTLAPKSPRCANDSDAVEFLWTGALCTYVEQATAEWRHNAPMLCSSELPMTSGCQLFLSSRMTNDKAGHRYHGVRTL